MSQAANLRGTLSITLHKADDLYDTELVTKQDPYVLVSAAAPMEAPSHAAVGHHS